MAIKYGVKKQKQNIILSTFITAFLLGVVFFAMVISFYRDAQAKAEENLHVQTKQIKDDIILQITSDRENLATMANFAAKLYSDNENYDLMFASFKPIGLIENIGILNSDNTFSTKAGTIDLNGLISFDEEKEKGEYISGRIKDLTQANYEIIRSAVPIRVNDKVVGILYGVIKLDKIGARYNEMAQEFDAQLFVYDKETGELIIDTIHDELGNISFLKDRTYNHGYSYEQMIRSDKGFSSFESAYRDENMHMHYSTIEELGWVISMARYDSQVFDATHELSNTLIFVFVMMLLIVIGYIFKIMRSERRLNAVTTCASDVRKILLETSSVQNNIAEALKEVCAFANSRSAVFFDTDGDSYHYVLPQYTGVVLTGDNIKYFMGELIRYAAELHAINGSTINVMCIKPNDHLKKTNEAFYNFLKEQKIFEVSLSAVVDNVNHTTILSTVNSRNSMLARMLAEKVAACFSIALQNKNRLSRTELAATTDSLTGAFNRVAYKSDLAMYDEQKTFDFSCLYIDVNELHACNNKYGHAAGDEMLIYIANTLKDVFYGHKVYRMGGDEFLVFCQNLDQETVKKSMELFLEQLKPRNYHVAVGMSYRTQNTNTEEMVREAELRMYEEKAQYYQNKEKKSVSVTNDEYDQIKTGILEIDTMLSVMKEHYNGIYRVSIDTDKAHRILMPSYLGYEEDEENFSLLFSKYVAEVVDPDYVRAVTSFLNYDAIRRQLLEGNIPKITYKKTDGGTVVLSVYKLGDSFDAVNNTLWVFAKA